MVYFRILVAATAGIGCYCGPFIDTLAKKTFKVKAQIHDAERTPGSELGSRFAKYGLPQRDVTLRYKHFQTSYDQRNRMPNWVVEHLNYDKLFAPPDGAYCHRNECRHSDPRIRKEFQSDGIDNYEERMVGSPLANYANYCSYAQGVADSYLMTNSVPQYNQFFTGAWSDLNIYCRYLTRIYDDVYVFSGPLFEPTCAEQMLYRVSQTNHLHFPNHYYKIIILKTDDEFSIGCFIMPNRRIGLERSLTEFRVPLQQIEEIAGFKLFKEGFYLPEEDLPDVDDFRRNRNEYMAHEPMVMWDDPGLPHVEFENWIPLGEEGQNGHNGHQHQN